MEIEMNVTSIGPIGLTRIEAATNAYTDVTTPEYIKAHIDIDVTDNIDDGTAFLKFTTRFIPMAQSPGASDLRSLEQQALRHLALRLRAIADALDASAPPA